MGDLIAVENKLDFTLGSGNNLLQSGLELLSKGGKATWPRAVINF